jgi:hypothetical protein
MSTWKSECSGTYKVLVDGMTNVYVSFCDERWVLWAENGRRGSLCAHPTSTSLR